MIRPEEVTIVIPCFNEEKTLHAALDFFSKAGYVILIALAKQSKDDTMGICIRNSIPYFIDNGKGKGAALKEAIDRVDTPYIFFIDADGSHDFKDVQLMLEKMETDDADLVIGSRLMGGSMELYEGTLESFFRSFFTLCINQIVNSRFGAHITDTQNGFRGGKTASLKKLGLKSTGFDIETEMVMKMLKKGMKIREIPAREYPRKFGSSGVSLVKHGWRYILTVVLNIF